jgi:predicted NUDIX family NTP pyrophosphohydrolase
MASRKQRSAGLLMYRREPDGSLRVLLAHPGGPFFARKDAGAWTIPKGEVEPDEDPRACALREFQEETGIDPLGKPLQHLGEVQQKAGKRVEAWAFQGEWNGDRPHSNLFELEWPPRSGKKQSFPEIDRLEWFELAAAREKLNPSQATLLDRLLALLEKT